MLSDLAIAQKAQLLPITRIAEQLGLAEEDIELHGNFKAKVSLDVLKKLPERSDTKYIDVTAITPTPLGEGKTVTTIGLSMGLNQIGKQTLTCIRQPSLGPVFGIKGGAAGGGYSQVVPMEDFNLHLTGDVHAISIANNLLAAAIDSHILHGNALGIDPKTISWRRVVDMEDEALRNIVTGLNARKGLQPRETGYDIAVASEAMAVLALATDIHDLRERLGKIVVGYRSDGGQVTAEDLKAAGAMTVLLKDALKPTLMQTVENTPVFVHAGPFANIAHGNSSILADQIGLRLADYVVTESGFGADCGMEKFMNIKCRQSGLRPDAVVMVCSIRALKMHSGEFSVVAGKPLDKGLVQENLAALRAGSVNLVKHLENVARFGVPAVVAINRFSPDTDNEVQLLREIALEAGADSVAISDVWAKGGEGGKELAQAVVEAAEKPSDFRFLYPLDWSIKKKIKAIATKIYGAADVSYDTAASSKIRQFTKLGYDRLPICMAKTHLSLSHDPKLKGRPEGFVLPIRDIRASVGAGFLYPLCGEMRTMPGFPSKPSYENVDIDEDGNIVGLF